MPGPDLRITCGWTVTGWPRRTRPWCGAWSTSATRRPSRRHLGSGARHGLGCDPPDARRPRRQRDLPRPLRRCRDRPLFSPTAPRFGRCCWSKAPWRGCRARLGLIPAEAAAFIDRASREVQIDPAALAAETARNGVPVPGLAGSFPQGRRGARADALAALGCDQPGYRRYRPRATSPPGAGPVGDAADALIAALGKLAAAHADLPMAARTYGQAATPIDIRRAGGRLGPAAAPPPRPAARPAHRCVAGLAFRGGRNAFGNGCERSAGPCRPGRALWAWPIPAQAGTASGTGSRPWRAWMAGLCATLGKMGEDLILLTATGLAEVRITGAGGSSTMPQKQNPVGPIGAGRAGPTGHRAVRHPDRGRRYTVRRATGRHGSPNG